MMTLEELIAHRDILDILKNRTTTCADEAEALEVAAQMLSALITQLDSQSISFTP